MARWGWTLLAMFASAAMLLASLFADVGAPTQRFGSADPPPIVVSPRLGHYDPQQGSYVWWR